jgi:hypothetical protein
VPAAPAADAPATDAPAADAESAPADAPAAPADDPHGDLNALTAGLDAQYDSLQVCKMRFASSVIKDIRSLSEQRDAMNAECSVLREFISEGLRAMKSEHENIGEAANPCTICFTTTVNTVVVPCGHTFCAECLKTHTGITSHSHPGKCPTPPRRYKGISRRSGRSIRDWCDNVAEEAPYSRSRRGRED